MQGTYIRLRVDGNSADPEALGGAENAASDLATIGNQDFFEERLAHDRGTHSGMLECLRAGAVTFLVLSRASDRNKRRRVECG